MLNMYFNLGRLCTYKRISKEERPRKKGDNIPCYTTFGSRCIEILEKTKTEMPTGQLPLGVPHHICACWLHDTAYCSWGICHRGIEKDTLFPNKHNGQDSRSFPPITVMCVVSTKYAPITALILCLIYDLVLSCNGLKSMENR
jgi:hypothetical protein